MHGYTNNLSTDAYHSPDSSGQEFIGWSGSAPYLDYPIGAYSNEVYWFLYYFYWYTLTQYFTSNAALDISSFQVFGTSYTGGYNENPLYTGMTYSDGSSGHMVTYGDGNIYPTGIAPPAQATVYFYTPYDSAGNYIPANMYIDDGAWVIPAGSWGNISPGEHTVSFDASVADYNDYPWPYYYSYAGCDWSNQLTFQWYLTPNSGQSCTAQYY